MTLGAPKHLEVYLPLVTALAYRVNVSRCDDLIQEGLIAIHRALETTPEPDRPFGFAHTVAERAMLTAQAHWHIDPVTTASQMDPPSGIAAEWDVVIKGADVYLENIPYAIHAHLMTYEALWEDAYFTGLERTCGQLARIVAENLISPKDPRVCARILNLVKEKLTKREVKGTGMSRQELSRKAKGGKLRIQISHKQVQLGLGIPQFKWIPLLAKIKDYTKKWLAAESPGWEPEGWEADSIEMGEATK